MKQSALKVLLSLNLDEESSDVAKNKEDVYITAPLLPSVIICPSCCSSDIIKNGYKTRTIKDGTNYFHYSKKH